MFPILLQEFPGAVLLPQFVKGFADAHALEPGREVLYLLLVGIMVVLYNGVLHYLLGIHAVAHNAQAGGVEPLRVPVVYLFYVVEPVHPVSVFTYMT